MHKKYLCLLVLCLIHASALAYVVNASYSQRQLFWQARQSLLAKNYQQFEQLKVHLKNYPLYPYLAYTKLKQQ